VGSELVLEFLSFLSSLVGKSGFEFELLGDDLFLSGFFDEFLDWVDVSFVLFVFPLFVVFFSFSFLLVFINVFFLAPDGEEIDFPEGETVFFWDFEFFGGSGDNVISEKVDVLLELFFRSGGDDDDESGDEFGVDEVGGGYVGFYEHIG